VRLDGRWFIEPKRFQAFLDETKPRRRGPRGGGRVSAQTRKAQKPTPPGFVPLGQAATRAGLTLNDTLRMGRCRDGMLLRIAQRWYIHGANLDALLSRGGAHAA
jgi:hypothetical protein